MYVDCEPHEFKLNNKNIENNIVSDVQTSDGETEESVVKLNKMKSYSQYAYNNTFLFKKIQ